ncbi:MAG: nucleotidyltransferase domain-containing protein [Bacteroidota bacterium]
MTTLLPDPDLVKAFRRAVRRHFEGQVALEREAAEARKAAVLPTVLDSIARARDEGLCERAWLFGSYAWGQPGTRSDVDILVDGCRDPFAVASLVGRACGLDVHVVDWTEAPTSLRDRVLGEGVTL